MLHKESQLCFQPHQDPGVRVALAFKETPQGTWLQGGKPTRHSPSSQTIHRNEKKRKKYPLVLLLFSLYGGLAGPLLTWNMCSVLLQDVGHLPLRWNTENTWVVQHQRGSSAAPLRCFTYTASWLYHCTSSLQPHCSGYHLWAVRTSWNHRPSYFPHSYVGLQSWGRVHQLHKSCRRRRLLRSRAMASTGFYMLRVVSISPEQVMNRRLQTGTHSFTSLGTSSEIDVHCKSTASHSSCGSQDAVSTIFCFWMHVMAVSTATAPPGAAPAAEAGDAFSFSTATSPFLQHHCDTFPSSTKRSLIRETWCFHWAQMRLQDITLISRAVSNHPTFKYAYIYIRETEKSYHKCAVPD